MKKYCSIDFEFNNTNEKVLNLVSCALKLYPENIVKTFWLHKVDKDPLKKLILELIAEGRIFIAHQVVSEASCFYSLGINPTKALWFDSFLEFRCLTNHHWEWSCGKQLIDGKVKEVATPRPKWMRTEGESASKKLTHSYGQAVYKMLGIVIDSKEKEEVRDLIISRPEDFSPEDRDRILSYNASDVVHLHPVITAIFAAYKKALPRKEHGGLIKAMLLRGEAAARTAVIERIGYPVDVHATKNFADSVPHIMADIQRSINKAFPQQHPFTWDKKFNRYSQKSKPLYQYIKDLGLEETWMRTDSGNLSLSLEAWQQHFDYKHSYPEDILGAQMVRLLKTQQNLNGFRPSTGDKKTFWDAVGSDGFVHPWLNPYGSQASRFQPSATSFLFLKSAWMRSLAVPPPGMAIVGIDYKSEEFLIKGIEYHDKAMIRDYQAGDVYLAFGKASRYIPANGTKQTHPSQRQESKAAVLGMSYDMTKIGLAKKLTLDTGKLVTEDEAQQWIDRFQSTYPDQHTGAIEYKENYLGNGYTMLDDGWIMFGDNPNERSVGNFKIQGKGAEILRRAIKYSQEAGLAVIVPLHDANYFLIDSKDYAAIDTAADCMLQAFKDSFTEDKRKYADVQIDIEAWSSDYTEQTIITPGGRSVKLEKIHKDERSMDEYNKFSKYFEDPDYKSL
jgi:hypothetical protein